MKLIFLSLFLGLNSAMYWETVDGVGPVMCAFAAIMLMLGIIKMATNEEIDGY